MASTKTERMPNEAELNELRREVEILELRARRKAALDAMRESRSERRAVRIERKTKPKGTS